MRDRARKLAGWIACLVLSLLLPLCPAEATILKRGVNLTNWFRYPVSRDPAVLVGYLSDGALTDLRAAGFDFVRLAIDPEVARDRATIITTIRRIQRQGLSVIVSPHPNSWHLESDPTPLPRFWRDFAPALAVLDPALTFPEILNEPVFPADAPAWAKLQHLVLSDIRAALPEVTVVLTGQDWGSIRGLLALTPEADGNVLYSFHFYEPAEMTSLAAWRPGLDRMALAKLPFPTGEKAACEAMVPATADAPTNDLMHYYCSVGWDAGRLADPIGRAAVWARRNGVHLLAGEFGATRALNPTARLAWFTAARQAFEGEGIAWALWGYDDVMGFDVPRPPPQRPHLDPTVLHALGLPPHM